MRASALAAGLLLGGAARAQAVEPAGIRFALIRTSVDATSFDGLAKFSVERWEGGVKSTGSFENWQLDCHYPRGKAAGTECSLHREIFFLGTGGLSWRNQYLPSMTSEVGSLTVESQDWEGGFLTFRTSEGVHVRLGFEREYPYLYITTMTATGVVGDPPRAYELRIPEFSHARMVPVHLTGFRDEERQALDAVLAGVGPKDAALWWRWRDEFKNADVSGRIKAMIDERMPEDFFTTKPTPARQEELVHIVWEAIFESLREFGLSQSASDALARHEYLTQGSSLLMDYGPYAPLFYSDAELMEKAIKRVEAEVPASRRTR